MAHPVITPASAATVRATIAATMLGATHAPIRLGEIVLRPHQIDAVHRIQRLIATSNGALLSDDVGLGKTYVALAVAARYAHPLIVTPAGLHDMWIEALRRTQLTAQWRSIESLSNTQVRHGTHDIIVIDEAHHLRTPATRRYATIAPQCNSTPTLLLSATPIHNHTKDLAALVALFLGPRAHELPLRTLSRMVVRRANTQLSTPLTVPRITPTRWIDIALPNDVGQAITHLPPPTPPHSGDATSLITVGLLRQWLSSDGALRAALIRRSARATTLLAALQAGRLPTRAEMRAWLVTDDAMQLTFPELMTPATMDTGVMAAQLRRHIDAVDALRHRVPRQSSIDQWRANTLQSIQQRHTGARIVAFTQYADTVHTLFHYLRHTPHVAALTSRGGKIAGGTTTRADVLARFRA